MQAIQRDCMVVEVKPLWRHGYGLSVRGLLPPRPGADGNWVYLTRRGIALKNRSGVAAYRRTNMLPKQLLHASISVKAWSTFLRGDYDSAVLQAFKDVEVGMFLGICLAITLE